ncbi:SDR family NAD(P)-dependent oxidoreductase [Emticicia sp. BO119]|uniref:SDR family NAD(P)-dependent oxidoreductase n=1 Tax=Emticicia sp. BO119 TaxID=2757768 RepID=UPI0015F0DD1E|nr:SDR family NAD(P)-dependent oxidoreductase [Emticicia sp. BO119]MBA4849131.1 SDR family oxidoreductase [Emticicia sp. BO119]
MKFKDKVVIITGGNSGIGKAAAILFAQEGAKIMVADLADALDIELADSISKSDGEVRFIKVNVTKLSDIQEMIEQTISVWGKFDILVNSAGVLGPRIRTEKYPEEDFDKIIDVNVKGLWYCMKAALRYFIEQRSGTIVNIASVAGHLGMVGHIAYAASKHAVVGMTKTAAIEFARHGIRINAVCPGFTQTPMLEGADTDAAYLEALQYATPMKRFGKPEEIASAILYLAADEASFITGQSVIVDGGLILQ